MDLIKKPLDNLEIWIPLIGSILGLISSILLFLSNGSNLIGMTLLGILALVGAILGFIAMAFMTRDKEVAGVLYVVSAILIVLHSSPIGVLGSILLLIMGIYVLFKNNKK